MFKKIAMSAAVLAAGFAVASVPVQADAAQPAVHAAATVLPYTGHYFGLDTHHRHVNISYNGTQLTRVFVNHQTFGTVHVGGHHMWHKTCANGWCTQGHWSSDTTIEGIWYDKNHNPTHFTATLYSH